jgi:hypothetical protein
MWGDLLLINVMCGAKIGQMQHRRVSEKFKYMDESVQIL